MKIIFFYKASVLISTAQLKIINSVWRIKYQKEMISKFQKRGLIMVYSGPALRFFTEITPSSILYTYVCFSLINLIRFLFQTPLFHLELWVSHFKLNYCFISMCNAIAYYHVFISWTINHSQFKMFYSVTQHFRAVYFYNLYMS